MWCLMVRKNFGPVPCWCLRRKFNMANGRLRMFDLILYIFLAFDFCRLFLVIGFFHPHHNGQWPPTSKDLHLWLYPLLFQPQILILEKEPVFPFLMLSAKKGNYWYHFYHIFGMMGSLTGDWTLDLPHLKPALYHYAIKKA